MAQSNDTSYKPGEDHGGAILTEAQVHKIRDWPKYYGYRQVLSRRFGVSPHTIDDVRNGKSWTHLGDQEQSSSDPEPGELAWHRHNGGRPVLTVDQVREIRRRGEAGESAVSVSRDYGVSKWTVYRVFSGKTWKDV